MVEGGEALEGVVMAADQVEVRQQGRVAAEYLIAPNMECQQRIDELRTRTGCRIRIAIAPPADIRRVADAGGGADDQRPGDDVGGGEGAFIGSNTALVAPVKVGAGAIVDYARGLEKQRSAIDHEVLLRSECRAWLAPSHPLANVDGLSLAQLENDPVVMLSLDELEGLVEKRGGAAMCTVVITDGEVESPPASLGDNRHPQPPVPLADV